MHLLKPFHISLKTAFARFFRRFSPILNFIAVTLTWNPKLLSLTAIEQFLCWWFRISIFTSNFLKWSLPEKSDHFSMSSNLSGKQNNYAKNLITLFQVLLFKMAAGSVELMVVQFINNKVIRFLPPVYISTKVLLSVVQFFIAVSQ